jgi:hypothetical protein
MNNILGLGLQIYDNCISIVQGKRPINLQVYGIIANFLIVVILLSVSIFN